MTASRSLSTPARRALAAALVAFGLVGIAVTSSGGEHPSRSAVDAAGLSPTTIDTAELTTSLAVSPLTSTLAGPLRDPTSTVPSPVTATVPTAPTSSTMARGLASPEKLSPADLDVVNRSGYQGLVAGKERMTVIARFDSRTGHNVVVGIDGILLADTQIDIMKHEVLAAEAVGTQRGSFTSHITLGPTAERDFTYDIGPAPQTTHYFFVYEGEIATLATGEDVSDFANEYTHRIGDSSITVVAKQRTDANVQGYDAQSFYDGVGVFQSYVDATLAEGSAQALARDINANVDMSYLPRTAGAHATLDLVGRELVNNAANLAWAGATSGKFPSLYVNVQTFESTRRQVMATALSIARYLKMNANYPDIADSGGFIGPTLWAQWQRSP